MISWGATLRSPHAGSCTSPLYFMVNGDDGALCSHWSRISSGEAYPSALTLAVISTTPRGWKGVANRCECGSVALDQS